eukprot:193888_1
MSEIVTINVGGCGNYVGNEYLSQILNEHWLDNNGIFRNLSQSTTSATISQIETRLNKIKTYFNELNSELFHGYIRSEIEQKYGKFIPKDIKNLLKYYLLHDSNHRFIPRTILIDSDPSQLDTMHMSTTGSLFKNSNFVRGASSAGHNFAKGYYAQGNELIDEIMDCVRSEVEACDSLQAFEMYHSLGGGTGSGLGAFVLRQLRDTYRGRICATFSVVTRTLFAVEVNVEPYNQTLALSEMIENADVTSLFDNDALFSISHNVLRLNEPNYADCNWIMSHAMSGITSTLRLNTNNNLHASWRKLGMNLIQFPRLHFLLSTAAPLFRKGCNMQCDTLSVRELRDQMWSSRNYMCNVRSEDGKFLSAAEIYRGLCDPQEIDDELAKISQFMADDFVSWIPQNMKATIVDVAVQNVVKNGTFLANTTALKGIFKRISARFAKNYKRKAFVHWYTQEGMDEMQFQEADRNVRDLFTEYQDKQDAVVWFSDEDDYDEDDEDEDDEDDESDFF